jgi:hypothetical protein
MGLTPRMHQSVYDRLALPVVRNFTRFAPYRPFALQEHEKAKAFFESTKAESFNGSSP